MPPKKGAAKSQQSTTKTEQPDEMDRALSDALDAAVERQKIDAATELENAKGMEAEQQNHESKKTNNKNKRKETEQKDTEPEPKSSKSKKTKAEPSKTQEDKKEVVNIEDDTNKKMEVQKKSKEETPTAKPIKPATNAVASLKFPELDEIGITGTPFISAKIRVIEGEKRTKTINDILEKFEKICKTINTENVTSVTNNDDPALKAYNLLYWQPAVEDLRCIYGALGLLTAYTKGMIKEGDLIVFRPLPSAAKKEKWTFMVKLLITEKDNNKYLSKVPSVYLQLVEPVEVKHIMATDLDEHNHGIILSSDILEVAVTYISFLQQGQISDNSVHNVLKNAIVKKSGLSLWPLLQYSQIKAKVYVNDYMEKYEASMVGAIDKESENVKKAKEAKAQKKTSDETPPAKEAPIVIETQEETLIEPQAESQVESAKKNSSKRKKPEPAPAPEETIETPTKKQQKQKVPREETSVSEPNHNEPKSFGDAVANNVDELKAVVKYDLSAARYAKNQVKKLVDILFPMTNSIINSESSFEEMQEAALKALNESKQSKVVLANEISAIKTENEKVKEENRILNEKLEENKKIVVNNMSEIEALSQNYEEIQTKSSDMEGKFTAEIEELKNQIEQKNSKIKELQIKFKNQAEQLEKTKFELSEIKNQAAVITAQDISLRDELKQLHHTNNKLTTDLNLCQENYNTLQASAIIASTQLAEAQKGQENISEGVVFMKTFLAGVDKGSIGIKKWIEKMEANVSSSGQTQ